MASASSGTQLAGFPKNQSLFLGVDGLPEKKYKNIGKELIWQWFFPAKTLTLVPEAGEYRRYNLHKSHMNWDSAKILIHI